MLFETTIRVAPGQVQVQPDEHGDAYELFVAMPVLMFIPVGPNQLAPIQGGVLRVGMNKETAKSYLDDLTEAEALLKNPPGSSGITIAGNMSEAERFAQEQSRFGG